RAAESRRPECHRDVRDRAQPLSPGLHECAIQGCLFPIVRRSATTALPERTAQPAGRLPESLASGATRSYSPQPPDRTREKPRRPASPHPAARGLPGQCRAPQNERYAPPECCRHAPATRAGTLEAPALVAPEAAAA